MASGNFISSTGVNLNLYVTWSSTTNVNTNTSSVTAKVYMRSYSISGEALADSYITINGDKKSFAGKSLTKSSSSLTDTLLVEHTVSVKHGSDGKKSITIKANLEFNGTVGGKYLSDITASKTVNLDNIPRASGLDVATSINTGSSLTATITPASSTFTHQIAYIIDNKTVFTSSAIAASTKTYAHTVEHSWLPKANSATMTVRLFTYSSSTQNDSTKIGTTDKSVTVKVPESIVPTVSNLTATVVNGLGGYYVEGKSQVKLTATATAGSGSTLSSYVFSGPNISGSASELTTTSATVTSSILKTDGSLTYGVIAKDGRPNRPSKIKEIPITVYPYANPKITSITAQRCDVNGKLDSNGTYAKVTVKTSFSDVSGANKIAVKLYSSKDSYATAKTMSASSNDSTVFEDVYDGGFAINTSYTIRAIITDSYNTGTTIQKSATLKVAERIINIAKYGNGVSIGGLSTVTSETASGLFEVNWPTKMVGALNVTGNIATTNSLGSTSDYNAYNFGIYCKWADAANHDILTRNTDGLTTAIGWAGSSTYETMLDVRSRSMKVRGDASFEKNVYIPNNQSYRTYTSDGATDVNLIKMSDGNSLVLGAAGTSGARTGDVYIYSNSDTTDLEIMKFGQDTTSRYVQSLPTYNRTYSNAANIYITSAGTFGRSTASSERYKKDIENVTNEDLNPYKILDIPVRQFKYNKENIPVDGEPDDLYIGLIAEEVNKVYPVATEYTEDGQIEMWNIKMLFPALLKIVQDQQKKIETLEEQISNANAEELKQRIAQLEAMVEALLQEKQS